MKLKCVFLFCIVTLLLVGCGNDGGNVEEPAGDATAVSEEESAPTNTPESTEPIVGVATVDSIEVMILESFPVEINIKARGSLPNGCTMIEDVTIDRLGNVFDVGISTIQEPDQVCTQALVAFEETIPLDVAGLPAGSYQVNVNGRTGSFTLSVDNVAGAIPTESPDPTPTTEPESELALLGGRVWHDLCAVALGEDDSITPSEGCVAQVSDDGFEANGLLEEDEPGIANVVVELGEGACPSTGFETAETDEDGDFVFVDLPAGTYCVSIDTDDPRNSTFQEEGVWTFPAGSDGAVSITLADGEINTDVNFGWDYAFLPAPEVDLTNCTNSFDFIEDLNIPDDTVFAPGDTFEKRWLLLNNGTCPWNEQYAVAFVDGDLQPDSTAVPFENVVVAGQTVEVAVPFTAPQEEGTYRGNFQLQDSNGTLFGVNGLIEEAFWAQIVVGVPEPTPEANSATIGGVVWDDVCFINADGSPSAGCVEIGESGFYRADGSLNFNDGRLADITVTLAQGSCNDDGTVNAANIVATTLTDSAGLYRFENLEADTYCVAVNALSDDNVNLLIPGDWTWPFPGVGAQGVILDAGEELLEVDFGWDFQ